MQNVDQCLGKFEHAQQDARNNPNPTREEEVTAGKWETDWRNWICFERRCRNSWGGKSIYCAAVSSSKEAQRNKKKHTRETEEKREKLADCILKNDTPAAETKKQISSGKISASLKPCHVKKSSTRERDITDEENRIHLERSWISLQLKQRNKFPLEQHDVPRKILPKEQRLRRRNETSRRYWQHLGR